VAEPFLSEIRVFSFGFPPKGWAMCSGQLLPINQNQALFSLLGTTYGGDGRVNFGLPDLQGRTPIHSGWGAYTLGERGGEQTHTLVPFETAHDHAASANTAPATRTDPAGNVWAQGSAAVYGSNMNAAMAGPLVRNIGGGQAHPNMQPFLVLNFSIALQGIFPSQT
jgi:microcystin-dependent protein